MRLLAHAPPSMLPLRYLGAVAPAGGRAGSHGSNQQSGKPASRVAAASAGGAWPGPAGAPLCRCSPMQFPAPPYCTGCAPGYQVGRAAAVITVRRAVRATRPWALDRRTVLVMAAMVASAIRSEMGRAARSERVCAIRRCGRFLCTTRRLLAISSYCDHHRSLARVTAAASGLLRLHPPLHNALVHLPRRPGAQLQPQQGA